MRKVISVCKPNSYFIIPDTVSNTYPPFAVNVVGKNQKSVEKNTNLATW